MTANELRIGNWVNDLCGNGIMQVDALVLSDIGMFDLQGIPLTPEVLMDCGFINSKVDWWVKSPLTIGWITTEDNFQADITGADMKWRTIDLQYLHQLQNLYFALTGTELEYNPIKETV